MKKSTKLLSVLLAVLMIFSTISVMASAYQVEYKTSEAITALNGYNEIDTVTRLPMDVRSDMILDWVDELLAGLNIYMDLSILGTLDAHSIDSTLDSLVDIIGGSTFGLAGGLGMIGDLKNLNVDALKTYRRSSTDTGSQYVLYSLLEWLGNSDNVGVIKKVVDGTIDFGNIVGQIVGPYESYIRDIPGLVAGLVAPLFERKDDTMSEISAIAEHSDMDALVKNFVIGLFSKPQSTTTYKEDANGNCISNHTLPTESDGRRYYYVKNGTSFTCYVYDTETAQYVAEAGVFERTEELDETGAPTGAYTYRKSTGEALKYYENGSYWLPSLAASGNASTIMDITSNTPAQMLYDMIPYVFEDLAPVVLNGSVKKLLGEWFGAKYEYIGEVGSDAVAALPDASDTFFTQPQGDYVWEWSDYKVINGTHYYRFEDQIFRADLSNANVFFSLVNFDYEITGDYLNEFIPASSTSNANTLLSQVNNLLAKAYGDCINADVLNFTWEAGDNSKIIDNVRNAFTAILNLDENSGEMIFQNLYDEDLLSIVKSDSGASNQKVVAVLLAFLAKSLMPQLVLPAYADINSMLEVGAVVVRELATQLIPGNDFDALIYSNYAQTQLASHTDAEWLDIILTMGSQIGVFYLNNITDLALTDPALGGFQEDKTWSASDLTVSGYPTWEATVDFIIDWALDDDNGATGAWKMKNLVTTDGLTIDRNSVQDPWVKLDTILSSLLPVNEILNITATDYDTVLEQAIRGNLVDAVVSLDVNKIVSMFAIPDASCLRTMDLESALFYVVRKLINDIGRFGDATKSDVVASTFTNINTVLSKSGLSTLVGALLPRLSECRVALIDTVVPFLNWLIGWSTNDQEFNAASVTAPRYSYNSSAVGTLNGTITVKNNSNGMERQYASDGAYAYDSNYEIKIVSAYANVDGISVSIPAGTIAAGDSAELSLSGSFSTAQPVAYTVEYQIYSAQGVLLNNGQTYTATAYSYLALTDSDENAKKAESDPGSVGFKRMEHQQYVFTKNVYASVNSWTTEFQNFNTLGATTLTAVNTDIAPVGEAANYFRHATMAEVQAEMPSLDQCNTILSIAKMGTPGSAHLYLVKDGIEAEDIPYGYYDMGQIAVKMKRSIYNKSATDGVVFVYYTDYGLEDLIDTCTSAGISEDRLDMSKSGASAAWAEYQAALLEATGLINMPYVAATMVSEWMPAVEASVARLEAAYNAIQEYFAGADISQLNAVYAATAGVNYQNVKFYRYAKYETAQRAADSIIAGQTAPVAPEKYIPGSDLSAAEIDTIVNGETNTWMKAALNNTVEDPDLTAYNEAIANWKAEPLMDYDVAIAAENLQLNYDRLIAKATDLTFLDREISAANARGFAANAELYTADSYAKYTEALAAAVAVNNNAASTQQEAFDAKYNLLVAENSLLLKTESAKETGALADLEALIVSAQDIFANPDNYTVVAGMDELDAYTTLLTALGYDYGDGILYSGSALDYTTYDRKATFTNLQRIAAAEDTLAAAIANFESLAGDPVLSGVTSGVVDEARGYVYGVPAGAAVADYFSVENGTFTVSGNGTGATLTVYNTSGAEVAVYTLVIFGDVNGDGEVTASDYGSVKNVVLGATLEGAFAFAADVTGDGEITAADYAAIKNCVLGADLTVNPYA